MRFLTMLATKCKVCKKRSTCNYKRMVACALAELPLQHHNVKVTIDLEDVKKEIANQFYNPLRVGKSGV